MLGKNFVVTELMKKCGVLVLFCALFGVHVNMPLHVCDLTGPTVRNFISFAVEFSYSHTLSLSLRVALHFGPPKGRSYV